MPIPKEMQSEMKRLNFHRIKDNEEKMCSLCEHGKSLIGGSPAYCYKTGFKIDWCFVCNCYEVIKYDT